MRHFSALVLLLIVVACSGTGAREEPRKQEPSGLAVGSGYWRPISAPNVLLPVDEAQAKLEFDLSQCVCGIIPRNIPTPLMAQYQPDQERLAETSRGGACEHPNQYVLTECMRARGWEPTLCAGRLPTGSGGSYCGAP